MGFYVEVPVSKDKARVIAEDFDGEVTTTIPNYRYETARGNGILVVVDNGPFEAAAFAFSEDEFKRFHSPGEIRDRKYVILSREVAEKISGYKR